MQTDSWVGAPDLEGVGSEYSIIYARSQSVDAPRFAIQIDMNYKGCSKPATGIWEA